MAAITAGVIGTVGGAALAADASKDAGKAAERGAKAAAGVSERQFDVANFLTANQRNIGNQALNALGARYGFTPAAGFGADYDPFATSESFLRGVGQTPLHSDQVIRLLKEGKSLDEVLAIGPLQPDANLKRLKEYGLQTSEIQRLRGGRVAGETIQGQQGSQGGPTAAQRAGFASTLTDEQLQGGLSNNAPGSEVYNALAAESARRAGVPQPGMVPPEDIIDTRRLRELAQPVDTSLAAFQESPDYQFRLGEGLKAVQNSAAARGGLFSGNALRGITDYASGLASGEYNDFFNRAQSDRGNEFNRELGQLQLRRNFSDSDFNRLANLAGIGTTATQNLNSIGVNTAGNIGNALIGAGNARASGIEGQANAFGQGLNNLGALAGFFSNQGNQRASGVNSLAGGFDAFRGLPPNMRFA